MQGVGWLETKLKERHECPVCAAVYENGNSRLDELVALATELKDLTNSVQQAPAKLDHELASLRQELRQTEGALSKIRQKRKHLEERSQELSRQRQQIRQIYLFVGRVEQALENVQNSQNFGDLRERISRVSGRIGALKAELDSRQQEQRIEAAVATVSAKIGNYARQLRLEHADENVRLNIRELTLQFSPLSGRRDFLWELGSGQNWVGYHIACLLALHEHFVTFPRNPVPRFLVIDQPSQVYFPEAWPSIDDAPADTSPQKQSADIEGVRRIFGALSQFMDIVDQQFQIIVTEHAGAITWTGLNNVHLVGNWREGKDEYLVPPEWLPPN
jgi:DNA-binding FrmR family transcriptional regulator